jgi:AcrR family transcriptional regulator
VTTAPLDRRAALRDAAVEFVLAHGLGDLSLHRLADELGTSVGMLVHWFGSRELLVAEVLAAIRERQRDAIRTWAATATVRTLADALREHWRWLSADAQEPYLRLVFEVHGLALQNQLQYPSFNEQAVTDWLSAIAELAGASSGRQEGRGPDPTLVLAAMRGLLLDLLSTGDRARVEHGFERLVEWVERESV